jgi:Uma2 family endonuclease
MAVQFRDTAWTYDDLRALPDDGTRYEIIEGVLYAMTGPKPPHAIVLIAAIDLLAEPVRRAGGIRLTAPIDVFFPGADPVQPDLLVLLPGGRAHIGANGVIGPPDLVLEVLSPSTRAHDGLTKRALYGRAGVREYWLADPLDQTLEVLALVGDSLHRAGFFAGDDRVRSAVLPAVEFPAAALFAGLADLDRDPASAPAPPR